MPYGPDRGELRLLGISVDKPDQVEAAWRQALAADRPCLIEFRTDPAVPPVPPHADRAQMKATASAVLHGDSDSGRGRTGMIRRGVKAKIQEFLPGSGKQVNVTGGEK